MCFVFEIVRTIFIFVKQFAAMYCLLFSKFLIPVIEKLESALVYYNKSKNINIKPHLNHQVTIRSYIFDFSLLFDFFSADFIIEITQLNSIDFVFYFLLLFLRLLSTRCSVQEDEERIVLVVVVTNRQCTITTFTSSSK